MQKRPSTSWNSRGRTDSLDIPASDNQLDGCDGKPAICAGVSIELSLNDSDNPIDMEELDWRRRSRTTMNHAQNHMWGPDHHRGRFTTPGAHSSTSPPSSEPTSAHSLSHSQLVCAALQSSNQVVCMLQPAIMKANMAPRTRSPNHRGEPVGVLSLPLLRES